MTIQNCNSQM